MTRSKLKDNPQQLNFGTSNHNSNINPSEFQAEPAAPQGEKKKAKGKKAKEKKPVEVKFFKTGKAKKSFLPQPSGRTDGVRDEYGNREIARSPDGSPRPANNGTPALKVKADRAIRTDIVIDTEFYTPRQDPLQQTRREFISSQIGLGDDSSVCEMFFHSGVAEVCNAARVKVGMQVCKVLETECDVFDFLISRGERVERVRPSPGELRNLPRWIVTFYAHFPIAELNGVFRGELKERVKQLQRDGLITHDRRTRCINGLGDMQYLDYVDTGFYYRVNGGVYQFAIRIVDSSALHGNVSYKDLAANVGECLQYKDTLSQQEKENMLQTAINKPLDFENYALGDLQVVEILLKNAQLMQGVYNQMEIPALYREPKLTIGATTVDLIEARLNTKLLPENVGKGWEDDLGLRVLSPYVAPTSPAELRKNPRSPKALLSKVQGGRCRNARPLSVVVEGTIVDIDISGCYGVGQLNQLYPVGKPETFSHREHSKNNHQPTLREFLKWYSVKFDGEGNVSTWGDLVPGLWFAVISTDELLSFSQDLIESRGTPSGKYETDLLARYFSESKNDTENEGSDFDEFDTEYGVLKMFENEIKNGILTHDLLQIILSVTTRNQRNELLRKIKITTSMVYPSNKRIEVVEGDYAAALEKLDAQHEGWKTRNTAKRVKDSKGEGFFLYRERECHAWIGIPMGDLITEALIANRKKAQIPDKKSPQQTMYKLFINSTYGVLVSRFFEISNPCVGNNITARARALAWCMERAFDSFQSITDGGCFELSSVNHTPQFNPKSRKTLKPLIEFTPPKTAEEREELKKLIDVEAWNFLAVKFPKLDIFAKEGDKISVKQNEAGEYVPVKTKKQGLFEFETKDLYDKAVFHGAANYMLWQGDKALCKTRGYEGKRKHNGWEMSDGRLLETDRYASSTPIQDFLTQLADNPNSIVRQNVAVKGSILKLKDYAKHAAKYDQMGLEPGDDRLKPLLFSELSIAQFTFKTWKQWHGWHVAITKAKNKNRQSIEGFFRNRDGTLDYQAMITWVHDAIERDVCAPFKELDASNHRQRDGKAVHPEKETLKAVRDRLELPFVRCEENAENEKLWAELGERPKLHYDGETVPMCGTKRKKQYGSKVQVREEIGATVDEVVVEDGVLVISKRNRRERM